MASPNITAIDLSGRNKDGSKKKDDFQLTADEARRIANRAGAELVGPAPTPDPLPPTVPQEATE